MSSPRSLCNPGESAVRTGPQDAPEQFLWRGNLHRVLTVLAHHRGLDVEEWRVRAAAGRSAPVEVFDLSFDWSAGCWTVHPHGQAAGVPA
jgi:hypothetical protein